MLTFGLSWDVGVDPVLPSLSFQLSWDVGATSQAASLDIAYDVQAAIPGFAAFDIAYDTQAPALRAALDLVYDVLVPIPGSASLDIAYDAKTLKPSAALDIAYDVAEPPQEDAGTAALDIAYFVASTKQGFAALDIAYIVEAPAITQVVTEAIERVEKRVFLDGVEVTDRLEGRAIVNAEEGAARVAELTLEQFGAYEPDNYINRSLVIDGRRIGAFTGEWHRLFTGTIDEPILELGARSVRLVCSDGLQNNLEARSQSQVAQITGGLWHRGVFRDDADGWEHAQDRMSTQPANIELSRTGGLVVTPWAAKAAPDFTYTDDDVVDDNIKVDIAKARDLHNVAKVSARVRFDRRWERLLKAGWQYPRSHNDWLAKNTTMPTKAMIRAALSRSGWAITVIGWREMPETGTYWVGPPYQQSVWIKTDSEQLRAFNAVLTKRWIQSVDHTGDLCLKAPGSIARYNGEIPKTSEAQYSVDNTDDPWTQVPSLADESPDSDASDTKLAEFVVRDESRIILGEGYSYGDVVDESDLAEFYACILAIARTDMLAAHRQSSVVFEIPFEPEMDRDKTVRLEHPEIICQGKVKEYEHKDDKDGAAWTTVELALSRGDPTTETAFTAPATPPPLLLNVDTAKLYGFYLEVGNQYGGLLSSPPYNPDKEGYSGNFIFPTTSQIDQPVLDDNGDQIINPDDGQPLTNTVSLNGRPVLEPGSEVYPVGYYHKNPEIPPELSDSIEIPRPGDYTVSIPTDELTILQAAPPQ